MWDGILPFLAIVTTNCSVLLRISMPLVIPSQSEGFFYRPILPPRNSLYPEPERCPTIKTISHKWESSISLVLTVLAFFNSKRRTYTIRGREASEPSVPLCSTKPLRPFLTADSIAADSCAYSSTASTVVIALELI